MRAIQERKIERVGGAKTIPVDVRVVAASNVDLADEVKAGRFRQELYFRLSVFPIQIPPLRDRRDDIPLLMEHFLRLFNQRHGRSVAGFTRPATKLLLAYDYPGNIRELQNLVERGVVYADDHRQIDVHHLFTGAERLPETTAGLSREGRILPSLHAARSEEGDGGLLDRLNDLQRAEHDLYARALAEADGNLSAAARALGLSRAKLEYRLQRNRRSATEA